MCGGLVVFPEACAVSVGRGREERVWDVGVESLRDGWLHE